MHSSNDHIGICRSIKNVGKYFAASAVIIMMSFCCFSWNCTAEAAEGEVYIDPQNGSDDNNGGDASHAVRTVDKAAELAGNGGTIRVMNVIRLNDAGEKTIENVTFKIAEPENWNLSKGSEGIFRIAGDTTLTLKNVTVDGNADEITNDSGALIGMQGGKMNIYDGTVITGLNGRACSAVLLEGGAEFNMFGGEISDNTAEEQPAGVKIQFESEFNMYDGDIKGNHSDTSGGGVYVSGPYSSGEFFSESGTFNMYGGTISGNSALNGGGVCNYGRTLLKGGDISGNTAEALGGGVVTEGNTGLILDGSGITDNNAERGGGVCVYGRIQRQDVNSPQVVQFEMKSGEISGNTAYTDDDSSGAGIMACYDGAASAVKISGGTIKDNASDALKGGDAISFYGNGGSDAFTLDLSGSPAISGEVWLDREGQVGVTGKFSPAEPVLLWDGTWTDYRPVVEYAQDLTPEPDNFTVREAPRRGYLTDGQTLQSINRFLVTFTDGEEIYSEVYVDPKKPVGEDQYPKAPEKEGYVFEGWKKADGSIWDKEKDLVTEDITLTAEWKETGRPGGSQGYDDGGNPDDNAQGGDKNVQNSGQDMDVARTGVDENVNFMAALAAAALTCAAGIPMMIFAWRKWKRR